VKGGGIAAILFATTLLSGAVFVMGLLAGYDVGRQAQIDMAQLATNYPLQSAPPAAAPSHPSSPEPDNSAVQSAETSTSPAPGTGAPATAASASPATLAAESPGPMHTPSPPSTRPERQRLVSASIPGATQRASARDSAAATDDNAAAPDSENPEGVDEPSESASNPSLPAGRRSSSRAAAVHHKAYNIEIEAAMDISGADKMMARLQKLGYTSHLVPTEIGGQRWYKVEVGPYSTAEEASNAEAEMRQRYDQTYGGAGRGNSAQASANDDSDE
jgi:cell division protein FtsN